MSALLVFGKVQDSIPKEWEVGYANDYIYNVIAKQHKAITSQRRISVLYHKKEYWDLFRKLESEYPIKIIQIDERSDKFVIALRNHIHVSYSGDIKPVKNFTVSKKKRVLLEKWCKEHKIPNATDSDWYLISVS